MTPATADSVAHTCTDPASSVMTTVAGATSTVTSVCTEKHISTYDRCIN